MDYKAKIMEEFIRLFVQKDCKEIKVDEIAENLGISKRTVYENFSSKVDIVEQSLKYYQGVAKARLMEACEKETNPLKKILISCYTITINAQHIKVSQFYSLKKYYPELSTSLLQNFVDFQVQYMKQCYLQAQQEGYISKRVDPESMFLLLVNGERVERQPKIHFMDKEYDTLKLFTAHLFTIIRGVSTLKGVQVCDEYLDENFEALMQ